MTRRSTRAAPALATATVLALAGTLARMATGSEPPAPAPTEPHAAGWAHSPTPATVVTRAECLEANALGQSLRHEGKFAAARAHLRVCNDPACPVVVSEDCTRRLDELEAAQPTIVFDARDGAGHDRLAVAVTMDGQPLASALDGTPLAVDRGEHTFTFAVPGELQVTERVVIKEAEKSRRYTVVIGAPPPVVGAPREEGASEPRAPAAAETERAPHAAMGTRQWVGLMLGAAGIGSLVLGSVFGVLTATAIRQQTTDCASTTSCPNPAQAASDHATWTADGTLSTATFVGGGVLVAAGSWIFLASEPGAKAAAAPPRPPRLVLRTGVTPRGASMTLRGEF